MSVNYVSIEVLEYAAKILKAVNSDPEARLACGWQSGPGDVPCNKPVEYLIPDGTRVSAGGDIEAAPQWRCREHLELELGEPAKPQPLFDRAINPDDLR